MKFDLTKIFIFGPCSFLLRQLEPIEVEQNFS